MDSGNQPVITDEMLRQALPDEFEPAEETQRQPHLRLVTDCGTIAPMARTRKTTPASGEPEKRNASGPKDDKRTTIGIPRALMRDLEDAIQVAPGLESSPSAVVKRLVEKEIEPYREKIAKLRAIRASK